LVADGEFFANQVYKIGFLAGRTLYSLASLFPPQHFQKVTYCLIFLHFVPERQLRIDAVPEAPSLSCLGDIAISLKVRDDAPRCLLGDAYFHGDFPGGDSWLLGNQAEHQSMIGNKLPSPHVRTSWLNIFNEKS
jgi:hypothetical protein